MEICLHLSIVYSFKSIADNVLSDETSLSNDDYVKKTTIKLIERYVDAPFISVLAFS